MFPFESRPECYLCYEKVTGRTLRTFRSTIYRYTHPPEKTTYIEFKWKCSNCGSLYEDWFGRCNACGEWNTMQETNDASPSMPKIQRASRTKKFSQEVSRDYIMQYLKSKSVMKQPIKIYYKDDKTFRVFYSYSFDNTYLRVPSTHGYDYKYLIDRIRNVE